jgi:uncharacterized protein (DUF3820 family)
MKTLNESDVLTFGKYAGKTVKEIVKLEPAYIRWLQKNYTIKLKTVKL